MQESGSLGLADPTNDGRLQQQRQDKVVCIVLRVAVLFFLV